jgi:hypothetical protein
MTMARAGNDSILRKGAAVVARRDLRDVPEGTKGKVAIVNGLSWIRYWVRFDNGVAMGSVNRADLATPDEWQRHLNGEDDLVAAGVETGEDAGAGAADDGGGVTVNGVLVPQKLIDRTKAARDRLGV